MLGTSAPPLVVMLIEGASVVSERDATVPVRDVPFESTTTVRPINPGASSSAGSEVDLTVTYAATKSLSFMAGYSRFFAGDYLKDTGSSSDAVAMTRM